MGAIAAGTESYPRCDPPQSATLPLPRRADDDDERTVATIAIIYNLGALIGGLTFGWLSDNLGRRRAMIAAALAGVCIVPLWSCPESRVLLTIGAFLMQFMVQGVFGVIPAHLAEMSPPEARGLFSGMAYQLGVLFASGAAYGEALIAQRLGYGAALALIATIVLIADAIMIAIGSERKGSDLYGHAERS